MPSRRIAIVALLASLSAGDPAWSFDRVVLTLQPHVSEGAPGEIAGAVTLLTEGEAPRSFSLSSDGPLTMEVPDRVPTRIQINAKGFWAAEDIVLPMGETVEKDLRLHPAGGLTGLVVPPRGEPLPPSLSVTLEPAEPFRVQRPRGHSRRAFPRTTQVCPVDSEGRWTCAAPAARLDLRLRVVGYVSDYRWGAHLEAGKDLDLGKLLLRPGASVVGWVRTADQSPLQPGAHAFLTPVTVGSRLEGRAVGVERRTEKVAIDGRGFFHFESIAPGSYTLRIEHPGLAPAEYSPVTVLEGRETNLSEPLVLDHPVRFEVALVPPVDPYGRPWRLLLRLEDSVTDPKPETVGADGLWAGTGLTPGSYWLSVESGQGRYEYTWWMERLTIEAGLPIYEIRLPVVEVVGTVRLGKEPIEAIVRFGGRFGARRLDFDTDEEGAFAGYLPEEGEWPVSVYSEETGWRNLASIPVELPPGERLAEVDIRIPDLTLQGEVVDAEGQPVADASVWAHPTDFEQGRDRDIERATSDENGRFRLRGLDAGSWMVSAELLDSETTSNTVAVELDESRSPEPVRLTLERWIAVEGRLVSAVGPVAGARIGATPRVPGEYLMVSQPQALSDADGRFRFRYPQRAVGVDLTILPPGFAAQAIFLPSPLSESITVQVAQDGGTLILDLGSFQPDLPEGVFPPSLLLHGDARLPLASARTWARLQRAEAATNGKLRIPMMAPGSYTLCVSSKTGGANHCAQGSLPPYGELVLRGE